MINAHKIIPVSDSRQALINLFALGQTVICRDARDPLSVLNRKQVVIGAALFPDRTIITLLPPQDYKDFDSGERAWHLAYEHRPIIGSGHDLIIRAGEEGKIFASEPRVVLPTSVANGNALGLRVESAHPPQIVAQITRTQLFVNTARGVIRKGPEAELMGTNFQDAQRPFKFIPTAYVLIHTPTT